MTMAAANLVGNIVEQHMIGKTTIIICDDAYINRTPEEIENTHRRVSAICRAIVMEARAAGKDV